MRMLYRHPGEHLLHGIRCEYTIVPDTAQAITEAHKDGWRMSPAEALEAATTPAAAPPEPTREDLVKLAESLGIKVDGRWSVARLRQEIDRVDDEVA